MKKVNKTNMRPLGAFKVILSNRKSQDGNIALNHSNEDVISEKQNSNQHGLHCKYMRIVRINGMIPPGGFVA